MSRPPQPAKPSPGTDLEHEVEARIDGRREGGNQTRRRLIDTAQEQLAERGEDAIRLRELTAAARTNMESVHYHFGSLRALLHVAEAEAVEYIVDAQIVELDALGPDATLYDIATAYFRPFVQALNVPAGEGRPHVRVLVRLAIEPPAELREWMAVTIGRAHDRFYERVRAVPIIGRCAQAPVSAWQPSPWATPSRIGMATR